MAEYNEINRQFEVDDKGIYKIEFYSPTVAARKEMISKEAFVEAFNKYIKDGDNN